MNKRWWKSFIKGDVKLKDGENRDEIHNEIHSEIHSESHSESPNGNRNNNREGGHNVSIDGEHNDALRAEAGSYDELSYRSEDMKKTHSVGEVYSEEFVASQDVGVYGGIFKGGDILRSDASYVPDVGVAEVVDNVAGSDGEISEREGKADFDSDNEGHDLDDDDEDSVNEDEDGGYQPKCDMCDEGATPKGRGASKVRSGYVRVDEREDFDERDFPTCGLEEVETVYDLERGRPFRAYSDVQEDLPFNTTVESAKEFFATEVLYRFDLLTDVERSKILGSYRLELRGYRGGVWTVHVDEDLTVNNRREEADVVLSMKVGDFLSIVNGELNPQLSFLARRVKVAGNIGKAVAFQSLLAQVRD